mgnify:CR=1 FL=1
MGLLTKRIKLLFDYYINSSLHVSFCIISYIITIKLINEFSFDWENISFVFFTTFFTYNFIKFYERVISKNRPISFVLKLFFTKALIAFLISFYLFFDLSNSKQITVLVTSVLTVLYTMPFISKFTLRGNPIIKIFTVTFCWTMMIVVLPFFEMMEFCNMFYYLLLIFCLVTAQMIPFEIRDKHKDMYNVKTIVHIYGIKNSKIIGYFILMTALTLTILTYYLSRDIVLKNSTTIIILVTGVLIYLSSEKQNKYYSSFTVESIPMIWLLIEFSLQVFFWVVNFFFELTLVINKFFCDFWIKYSDNLSC